MKSAAHSYRVFFSLCIALFLYFAPTFAASYQDGDTKVTVSSMGIPRWEAAGPGNVQHQQRRQSGQSLQQPPVLNFLRDIRLTSCKWMVTSTSTV